jgi:predicted ribosome quality control (RQC) complex YloA/Tae2 family protein
MIQRYGYLLLQVNYLNSFLQNHGLCQKIFSTPHFLCFGLRRPGETIWLYLGRGGEYQGFWLSKTSPPSTSRIQDTFLSLARKHLITPWISLKLDSFDRIISIKSSFYAKHQYFLMFWNGNDSYFLLHYHNEQKNCWIVHKSWSSNDKIELDVEISEDKLFDYFNDVGRKDLPDKQVPDEVSAEGTLAHQIERYIAKLNQGLEHHSNTHNKKQLRKLSNIKKDLEKLSHFNNLKNFLDTNPVTIDDELRFGDLKIKFPKGMNVEQKRNFAFNKLKNWKKNYVFMQERLSNEELAPSNSFTVKPEKILKPIWKNTEKKSKATSATSSASTFNNCDFFELPDFHASAALGKSAQANDQLRNSWSKKSDYWFHLQDMPSAHLYIRPTEKFVLSQELFNLIGSTLLEQGNSSITSGNLIYCLAKDLKPVKGSAGSVRFKNEKRVLFFRKVPRP